MSSSQSDGCRFQIDSICLYCLNCCYRLWTCNPFSIHRLTTLSSKMLRESFSSWSPVTRLLVFKELSPLYPVKDLSFCVKDTQKYTPLSPIFLPAPQLTFPSNFSTLPLESPLFTILLV